MNGCADGTAVDGADRSAADTDADASGDGGAAATDPALGPPTKMLAVREELTPMMSQYVDLCEGYDDALVLFQVGDFYEAFCEAAETVARVCEVTLTKREDSTGRYPMAGVPIDNAASYVERLLDAGYRVAVADQIEDAEEATGLVDRAVTELVTPGTVVDDELLEAGTSNYLGALARAPPSPSEPTADRDDGEAAVDRDTYALAVVDVSTGECTVTSADRSHALEELERLSPAELLTAPDVDVDLGTLDVDAMHTAFDAAVFDRERAHERVSAYLSRPEAVLANAAELRAAGAALAYAEYTQGGERLEYVSRVRRVDPREYMQLDATALRSLELFDSRGASRGRTLVDVLDETSCALGRRRLRAWLRRPELDREEIEARLDAVETLAAAGVARETLRDHLRAVYDLERLVGRVSRGRATARDLRSLATTLDAVPAVRTAVEDALGGEHTPGRLESLRDRLDDCTDVRDLVEAAIVADPPQEITEGGVVREGFDAELDSLRETEREGREWVADLEARERERTGIDSLEVGYTQVHGYYIEVTNPNLDSVPDDYTRRQTLKNSERFYTPELKRREDEILSASERADSLEYEVFCDVRSEVATATERIQDLADALSDLDVLASLATVAVDNDYVRPSFGADRLRIDAGRHPVVERATEFVPNDVDFERGVIAILTGPNMSGKSTYMRQVALCCILAQVGSFVPADAARLPIVDRVFTRVGASDDIAGGQSTFMREMAELTDILHEATTESLVLLDEVGRGTSTTDGLAIARATTEFLHDEVGATTLFATHYHELTDLAAEHDGVFNLHFTAARETDDVRFLHRVAEGASSSSYGVEVARMAGVPEPVVDRARTLVDAEEGTEGAGIEAGAESSDASDEDSAAADGERADARAGDARRRVERAAGAATDGTAEKTITDASLADDGYAKPKPLPHAETAADAADVADVLADLRDVDVARTTPLEALSLLDDLQQRLDTDDDD